MAKKKKVIYRPQRFDVVVVEWLDTEQNYDWTNFASFDSATPPTIQTVGFLYEDKREKISLFQSMDSTVPKTSAGTFDSILTIPKCSVKSIRVIKKCPRKTP